GRGGTGEQEGSFLTGEGNSALVGFDADEGGAALAPVQAHHSRHGGVLRRLKDDRFTSPDDLPGAVQPLQGEEAPLRRGGSGKAGAGAAAFDRILLPAGAAVGAEGDADPV